MIDTDKGRASSMTPELTSSFHSHRVNQVCARFVDAWRNGEQPRLEEFLTADLGSVRQMLLRELLRAERTVRIERGENPTADEYFARLSESAEVVTEVFGETPTESAPDRPLPVNTRVETSSATITYPRSDTRPVGAEQETHSDGGPTQPAGVGKAVNPLQNLNRYTLRRLLGEGGYGQVFLAHDGDLNRLVAIKVPRPRLFTTEDQVQFFLSEARLAAGLKHPAIVTVFDVSRGDDGNLFVVLEYVEGQTLADALREGRLPLARSVELMIQVCDAVHHAHTKGLIHRDLKPSNILLDSAGNPHVTDFGLAIHEESQRLRTGEIAGTPAFMAPEQVRGETHRLDGRTDLWGLGVVLYRMLTGRLPFAGTESEVFDEILHREPKPPRQLDDRIPRELERICLKCLSKRMADRYTTASDLAEDLRHWLAQAASEIPAWSEAAARSGQFAIARSHLTVVPARVTPRGLRSFEAADSATFLALLPGPYDRDGLPESLRFWKARIEPTDPDESFTVGLLYGPTGCGKSSLVKAGLIPRLAGHVRAVYLEASPDETEARLERVLRKTCSGLPSGLPLGELVRTVREDGSVRSGKKVVIIVDQFEQWLHARRGERGSELVAALRQSDGAAVQCLVMVRDDFGMAAMRFMNELEVPVVEGKNYATVDRFDQSHAEHVLTLFGRAFGQLPADGAPSAEQARFLAEAVEGMAEDGKIVPIRLALFAEMFRGKPWTLASLKEVGGAEGIGVAFLEENLGVASPKPQYRIHQQAARQILKALLPDHAVEIKGHMRSHQELLEASGYKGRPRDFHDLIRILRSDLRLIMPGDPESGPLSGDSTRSGVRPNPGGRYYQLTHDYLVPALRTWLTHKQRESIRGRAALMLEECACLWNVRPERRYLPTFLEWASIALLVPKSQQSPPQAKMMRAANRLHSSRLLFGASAILALLMLAAALNARLKRDQAVRKVHDLTERLLVARMEHVPGLVDELASSPPQWRDRLAQLASDPATPHDQRIRAHLALVREDRSSLAYLRDHHLLAADPHEHRVIRRSLAPWKDDLLAMLWDVAADPTEQRERRLCAAAALAEYDPSNERWNEIAPAIAKILAGENVLYVKAWAEALAPVSARFKEPLLAITGSADPRTSDSERMGAISLLAAEAERDPDLLHQLAKEAHARQYAIVFPYLRRDRRAAIIAMQRELAAPLPSEPVDEERAVGRKANAAITLLRLGELDPIWPLLAIAPDPRLRALLIHRMRPFGVPEDLLADHLVDERSPSVRQAILLALGEEPAHNARKLVDEVASLYAIDPDAGVHAAAEWLLRRWKQGDRLERASAGLVESAHGGWSVNGEGQTMIVVRGPLALRVVDPHPPSPGDPPTARGEYRFAIAAHEVTREQYLRLDGNATFDSKICPDASGPMINVSWYAAARYCRRLSEREGVAESQMCYPPVDRIGPGMELPGDFLERTGYRLPTVREWEYACRAGTTTRHFFGKTDALLDEYAWYAKNPMMNAWDAENGTLRVWPVGSLKPNPFGLFDVYGNVLEWCFDHGAGAAGEKPSADDKGNRVGSGGYYKSFSNDIHPAAQIEVSADRGFSFTGFRVARTIAP